MNKLLVLAAGALAASLLLAANAGARPRVLSRVSPADQTSATEPSVAVDPHDGTVWAAWQGGGTHVARSDDGGRHWVETPINDLFGNDVGDVAMRVGGPTPCSTGFPEANCIPGSRRAYVSSLEELPLPLQTHLAYTDDRGAHWTLNDVAATNPSFIDRPWLAVDADGTTALQDKVYIEYHDFSASQINVAASTDGGETFGPSVDVLAENALVDVESFCDTIPSGVEVDPQTHDVYVEWITADPVANTSEGCNISQIENFHQVYVAHSAAATGGGAAAVTDWTNDAHLVFDGGPDTNTDVIFTALGVDDSRSPGVAGNVYAFFADNLLDPDSYDLWLSTSADRGQTWPAQPLRVTEDRGRHYFPWMAAGSSGRADFIWIRTADTTPSDDERSPWRAYLGQAADVTGARPRFRQTAVSPRAMHVGGLCTHGIFCSVEGGNRDLADSISIVIDRGGAAAMVWTDQGTELGGPTHIEYACVDAFARARTDAEPRLACRGPGR